MPKIPKNQESVATPEIPASNSGAGRKALKRVSAPRAAAMLGWSDQTVRDNLNLFEEAPYDTPVNSTPGGQARILEIAVRWVRTNYKNGPKTKTADEICDRYRTA